ncbi:MAG: ABC transporter permease [Dehalococcoidia bacterium]|jgi:predicted permease|nr:ABC transporter permease [Dehalococcoidia bacterium]
MSFLSDLRFGIRILIKRPGIAAIAVIALALGIGLTTTMFSIVHGLVIRGMPYPDSDELVDLMRNRPATNSGLMAVTIHDFQDWRAQQTSFEEIAAYYGETVNVSGTEGRPIRYQGVYGSARLFDVLEMQPILGRTFRPEEDHPSTPPVIILSHRAWQDRFQGDPEIVGKTIRANSEMTTIVGVMPERFDFPAQSDAWLPLRIDPLEFPRGSGPALEGTQIQAIARLKDGVTLAEAQTEMATIAGRLEAEYPETNEGIQVVVRAVNESFIGRAAINMLYTMLGAVFGVLLIACVNVANLLLARTVARSKEVAVRTALGSSRWRTISQLLAETLILAIAGGGLGMLIGQAGITWFNGTLVNVQPPLWLELGLNRVVVTFVVGLTVLSTLLAGTVPALRASSTNLTEVLNDEARGSSGLRLGRISKGLVIAELAISCGLLVGAGLMIKTIVNVANLDYGFTTANIFTARLGLLPGDYPTEADQRQFYDELVDRLGDRPGIRTAALASNLPASGGPRQRLSVDGTPYPTEPDHPMARRIVITPDYFEAFDVAPTRGRGFTRADGPDNLAVAIVNERFVTMFLEGDPIGARVKLGDDAEPWRTVVGVVPDMYLGGATGQLDPRHEGVYTPLAQNTVNYMSLVVRTEQAPMTYTAMVQDEINAIDATLPIYFVRSLEEQFSLNTWFYRAFGGLFMAFGFAALALATIGLYGVMSFSASNRTREIGVRMALGAQAQNVLALFLRQGVAQVGAGLLLGVGLAALLSQGLSFLLFDVEPWDPGIFTAVVLTLSVTGILACLIPARRATGVNPVEALRQ